MGGPFFAFFSMKKGQIFFHKAGLPKQKNFIGRDEKNRKTPILSPRWGLKKKKKRANGKKEK